MPLPGSRVLHPAFQAAHRPAAEQAMTVRITFARPGAGVPGAFDPATGTRAARSGARPVAVTKARVQATASADRTTVAGEQVITLRGYTVSVPVEVTGLRVDDVATVTSIGPEDDPDLLGARLRVRDVVVGSITWQRVLVCEQDLG
jgi:hypothetical protein